MRKSIERLQPITQLILDRELGILATHRACERDLQRQISDLDREVRSLDCASDILTGSQFAIWQKWLAQERKRLLSKRAGIRAEIETATVAARRALGRAEAIGKLCEEMSG